MGDVKNIRATIGIYDHLSNNEGHKAYRYICIGRSRKYRFWTCKEVNWKWRKIKESIYIHSLSLIITTKIDPSKQMHMEKGFDLDPLIWSLFNPVFRDIMLAI